MIEAEIKDVQSILDQHGYKYKEYIGGGSFSHVFLCESEKYHKQFALKRAMKHRISVSEYETLVSLNHPNVIRLYDAFEDNDWHYLVMEYCPNGTARQKTNISYEKFIFYAKQLLDALFYCHSQKIAHRDIKPDNIFVDQYDHIKLADFGMSKKFDDKRKSTEKCGSLIFFAPEMFQCSEIDPFKADIWALGITFYYLVTGNYPFKSNSREELKKWVIYGDLDFGQFNIDSQIRFLISKMTNKKAELRPTAESLLKLPMFSPISTKKQSLVLNPLARRNTFTTGISIDLVKTNNKLGKPTEESKKLILSYGNIVVYPNIQRIGIRNLSKPN